MVPTGNRSRTSSWATSRRYSTRMSQAPKGALIAAPLGAYIQFFEERIGGPRSFSIAATADAVLLMAATTIAFAFILSGNVQKHRQWMTRSFAVALVFIEVRVIGDLTGWDRNPATIETIVWTCLVFALFLADSAIAGASSNAGISGTRTVRILNGRSAAR